MNVIIVLVLKSVYAKWEESSVQLLIVALAFFLNPVNEELSVPSASLCSVGDAEMLTIPEGVQLLKFNRHPRGKTLIVSIKMLSVPDGSPLVRGMLSKYQKLVLSVALLLRRLKVATT